MLITVNVDRCVFVEDLLLHPGQDALRRADIQLIVDSSGSLSATFVLFHQNLRRWVFGLHFGTFDEVQDVFVLAVIGAVF